MRELLNTCAKIERAVSDLYFLFEQTFSTTPQLALLWQKTAREELNHEQQFLLASRLYASQLTPDSSVSLERLLKILDAVHGVHNKAIQSPPSPKQALKLAISLEEQLVETHLKAVLCFDEQSVNRLFKAMMAADHEHVAALQKFFDTGEVNEQV